MSDRKIFAASNDGGCAVRFFILILIIVFLIMFLSVDRARPLPASSGSVASAPTPTATFLPGTPSPVPPTSTPIPAPGTPTYACQSGIEVGKTIDVVHEAVRMRLSPGYVKKDDEKDTNRYLQTGYKVVVKDGPKVEDGLCWWFIEYDGSLGWTADHSREGLLLLSANP